MRSSRVRPRPGRSGYGELPTRRIELPTHEIRIMERRLARAPDRWRTESVTRVFQKGRHPRIYLLRPMAEVA